MIAPRLRYSTVLIAWCLVTAPLGAQVVRLPAVMPPSEPYPATKGSPPWAWEMYPATNVLPASAWEMYSATDALPASAWEPYPSTESYAVPPAPLTTAFISPPGSPAELPPTEMPPPLSPSSDPSPSNPDRPPDARDGMFQKLTFKHEWIGGRDLQGLVVRDLELKTVLALPIPSRDWPLLITPGFAVHYLDGPLAPDLPPRVYDAYAQFKSLGRINPRLGVELAVTVGAFGDFEDGSGDPFRIIGHGAGMWTWTSTTKLVLGAAYIDCYDYDVIPIGGVIWKPNKDVTIEAVYPRPKIARRIYWRKACTDEVQDWLYLAGEFGNDTWAIQRAAGFADKVNYRDWRILLGLERKSIGRLDRHIEVGYVFSRRLHYDSMRPEFDLNDAFMIRAGLTY